ncbi:alpha/beta hydrolase [Camelimonas fluminis]|uniref:Alpha/beta hydrolase n=1 Tax=Camelimonas fluminis TaxID=1576911 RepID=A0ABV7UNL5_9HYPH|nr:alpha/beta fold hydrolase [Camelimonas fluminis]GHE57178.1 alpha/beta hydrolase [Camelimonas fluminis]
MGQAEIATGTLRVATGDSGVTLFVRNKVRRDVAAFTPERTLLFVHGATYPASTSFDLALDGVSWMDYIASRGYDVYLMDLRGYGSSTRPPEMAAPAADNPPVVRGVTAIADIGRVVEAITRRRGVDSLCLLGWSWGTTLTGAYAASFPDHVHRLALYAPLWVKREAAGARSIVPDAGGLPAWRGTGREEAYARWVAGVPEEALPTLIPPGWFDAWADATFATDPDGMAMDPPVLRAPNGVLQDVRESYFAGRPYFDPSRITAPTLLAVGAWDADTPPAMAEDMFRQLSPSPHHQLVIFDEGSHTMMMERNRLQLFETVQAFLDRG